MTQNAPPKLTRVYRLDSVPLHKAYYTEEGYLRDNPVLTRTGIFEYTNPDGSVRRELRLPDEVFDPESLASYRGKPIIITHDAGLITKDNVHREGVGTILSEGYRDGDEVRADIVIHDTDEMKASGLKELSLGYDLDLDETPGVWEGKPYDAIQRNIVVNHLALVLEARAGGRARLNIDGRSRKTNSRGVNAMSVKTNKKSGRTDGVLSPEELAKAIEQYQARKAASDKSDEEGAQAATKEAPVVNAEPPVSDGDEPVIAPAGEEAPADGPEAALQQVKDNRDRRDTEGEPENEEAAKAVIAQQDEDIGTLCDIIDTLLAERDFGKAEENADGCGAGKKDGEGECSDKTACDGEDDTIPSTTDTEPEGQVMNADSVDAIVRQRVQLGIIGSTLNLDGLENMKLLDAKKAVIAAVRPGMRLDGKGETYINAAYDMARSEVMASARKDTGYQKRQMFNKDSAAAEVSGESSAAHRQKMIDRQMKKKEDK